MKKRMLLMILLVAVVSTFAFANGAKESVVEQKEQTSLVIDDISYDELVEKAKAEGKLVVYASTDIHRKACEAFAEKYGIEVEFTHLGDTALISKVVGEAEANVTTGADVIFSQDGASLQMQLIDSGYVYNWVSSRIAEVVDESNLNPLVHEFCTKAFIYNNETTGDQKVYYNVWQLTDPEYAGLFQFKDPTTETVGMNFLAMCVTDEYADELAKAYKEYYGKDIVLTTENAGYEWIKGLYENGMIMGKSDTKIAEAVGAKGQNQVPIGLFTFSKFFSAAEKNLALATAEDMIPFGGFYYPLYSQITSYCQHPYAAKLYIEFVMSEEGWAAWNGRVGHYSANVNIHCAEKDFELSYWDKYLLKENAQLAASTRASVEDFINQIAY